MIRSGRAAHETTLVGFEGRPGARPLYREVFCDAIEQLQRDALDKPRPELVVKVDRSDEAFVSVDCSGVTFMDSAGYHVLVDATDYAVRRGHTLVIRNWGERSFYCLDPDGNRLCFVEETPLFLGRGAASS